MSRKMLAAIRAALASPARVTRSKSTKVKAPKIPKACDREDDVDARHREEGGDDPERDQGDQRPDQAAGPTGVLSAGGVAVSSAQGRDGGCSGSRRMPEHGRVSLGVGGDERGDRTVVATTPITGPEKLSVRSIERMRDMNSEDCGGHRGLLSSCAESSVPRSRVGRTGGCPVRASPGASLVPNGPHLFCALTARVALSRLRLAR